MAGRRAASGRLTVVGTGFGLGGQITPEALAAIRGADRLFHVVSDPPLADWLAEQNRRAESLNDAYAPGRARVASYCEMVERIVTPVRAGLDVCAAFYGHPGFFACPAHAAIELLRKEGFAARMLPGISSLDCLYADLGVDPGPVGCQSFEATDFLRQRRRFDPRSLLILFQIGAIDVETVYRRNINWNRAGVRRLVARLRQSYSADHPVTVYEASPFPVCEPRIERVPLRRLAELDLTTESTLCVEPRGSGRSDSAGRARPTATLYEQLRREARAAARRR